MFRKNNIESKFDKAIKQAEEDNNSELVKTLEDIRSEANVKGFREGINAGAILTCITLPIGWAIGSVIGKKIFK